MRFVFKSNAASLPSSKGALFGVSASGRMAAGLEAGNGAFRVKECLTATTKQQTSEMNAISKGWVREMCNNDNEDPNNQEESDSCSEAAVAVEVVVSDQQAEEDNQLVRMIRTIHDQQQQIQRLGKCVISQMERVKSSTKQELAVKSLLDQCSVASHEFWQTIHEKEKRVAQLKQQLQMLRERQNPTFAFLKTKPMKSNGNKTNNDNNGFSKCFQPRCVPTANPAV